VYHDQYQQKAREIANKIFDSFYLLDYDRETINKLLFTKTKLTLLNQDEKLLKEYANIVYGGKGVLTIYVTIIKKQKQLASNIIEQISKEYSIQ
jgi:hypothetical protein